MKVLSAAALFLLNGVMSQDCPDEYTGTMALTDTTSFSYAVAGDYLCGHVESEGDHWVSIGVAQDDAGKMAGGESIVGVPEDETVQKYTMVFGAISPAATQSLAETSLDFVDGKTVMKFAKLLNEDGEHPIVPDGDNTMLWAMGSGRDAGYHAARGHVTLNPSLSTQGGVVPDETPKCSFCAAGVPDGTVMRPSGFDCATTVQYAGSIAPDDDMCAEIKADEELCCPPPPPPEDPCTFCTGGVPDGTVKRPSGFDCASTVQYAATMESDNDMCALLQADEELCCPSGGAATTVAPPTTVAPSEDVDEPEDDVEDEPEDDVEEDPASGAASNAMAAGAMMGVVAGVLML